MADDPILDIDAMVQDAYDDDGRLASPKKPASKDHKATGHGHADISTGLVDDGRLASTDMPADRHTRHDGRVASRDEDLRGRPGGYAGREQVDEVVDTMDAGSLRFNSPEASSIRPRTNIGSGDVGYDGVSEIDELRRIAREGSGDRDEDEMNDVLDFGSVPTNEIQEVQDEETEVGLD